MISLKGESNVCRPRKVPLRLERGTLRHLHTTSNALIAPVQAHPVSSLTYNHHQPPSPPLPFIEAVQQQQRHVSFRRILARAAENHLTPSPGNKDDGNIDSRIAYPPRQMQLAVWVECGSKK